MDRSLFLSLSDSRDGDVTYEDMMWRILIKYINKHTQHTHTCTHIHGHISVVSLVKFHVIKYLYHKNNEMPLFSV